jgi:hypothetical protein
MYYVAVECELGRHGRHREPGSPQQPEPDRVAKLRQPYRHSFAWPAIRRIRKHQHVRMAKK